MRQTELRGYLPAFRRWWPTLLASALIAGVAGALMANALPRTYEARSQLLVGPVNASADDQRAAGSLARTYAELVISESFLRAAIIELRLTQSVEELTADLVRASGSNTTRFVVILAKQETAQKAADLANFLAERLIDVAAEGRADSPEGEVSVIDSAAPPSEPSGPRMSVLALAAAMAGGLGALLLAVATEYFSDRVRDSADMAEAAGRPLLGTVDLRRGTTSQDALTLRRIASVILLEAANAPTTVAIVPINVDDGSALAMEIARALTEFGKRVTLITHEPEALELAGTSLAGLPTVVGSEVAAQGVLSKEKASDVVEGAVLGEADVVVVASPSLGTSPHGLIWTSVVKSTILSAVERGATRKGVLHAAEAVTASGGTIQGIVVVKSRRTRRKPVLSAATGQPAQ